MKFTYDSLDDIIIFDDVISPVYQDWLFFSANNKDLTWLRYDNVSLGSADPNFKPPNSVNQFKNGFSNIHNLYQGDEEYCALNLEKSNTYMHEYGGKSTIKSELLSTFMPLALEISELIGAKFLHRMRINSIPQMGSNQVLLPHIDTLIPGWSVIYYLNDSDGDTIIYEERCDDMSELSHIIENNKLKIRERVSPKKGRAVAFKNNLLHSASYPKYNSRFVVNMNFFEKPDYESKKDANINYS